jgi:cardiolipin synthase
MTKKKGKKKVETRLRNTIVGILSTLMVIGSYWFSEQATKVELPHSEQPAALYSNQNRQDLQQTFLQAISHAKKSVLLLVYSLSDESIQNALKQKSEEGINVKVIFDGKSTPFADRKLGPKVDVLKRFGKGLMHMKILVIDGEQVLIGSANMTTDSLKMHGNLVMAFHSPELAETIKQKASTLTEEGPCTKCPPYEFKFADQKMELWFLPSKEDAADRIKQIVDSAKKTVRVAMFTFTRQDLAEAIVEASKRGIKAEVVMDHYCGKGAGAKVVKYLKKNGIDVRLSTGGGLLHHKFLWVDGKTLVNGSTNWTKSAFTKNDDCFVVLNDLNESQRKLLDNVWKVIKNESASP